MSLSLSSVCTSFGATTTRAELVRVARTHRLLIVFYLYEFKAMAERAILCSESSPRALKASSELHIRGIYRRLLWTMCDKMTITSCQDKWLNCTGNSRSSSEHESSQTDSSHSREEPQQTPIAIRKRFAITAYLGQALPLLVCSTKLLAANLDQQLMSVQDFDT